MKVWTGNRKQPEGSKPVRNTTKREARNFTVGQTVYFRTGRPNRFLPTVVDEVNLETGFVWGIVNDQNGNPLVRHGARFEDVRATLD